MRARVPGRPQGPEGAIGPEGPHGGQTHTHDGSEVTTGIVADARIAASIARDAEIVPNVLANDGAGSTLDADLLDGLNSGAFALAGTPADIIAQTEALFAAGASRVEYGTPHGLSTGSGLELLGQQVLPAFANRRTR